MIKVPEKTNKKPAQNTNKQNNTIRNYIPNHVMCIVLDMQWCPLKYATVGNTVSKIQQTQNARGQNAYY